MDEDDRLIINYQRNFIERIVEGKNKIQDKLNGLDSFDVWYERNWDKIYDIYNSTVAESDFYININVFAYSMWSDSERVKKYYIH